LAVVTYAIFIARTSIVAFGQRHFVLFEDAMISMRYARNLAEGNGLVWNAGEAPVEGYTNFLWTLWMAVPHAVGLSDAVAPLFVMLSGAVLLVAAAAFAARIAARVHTAKQASDIAFVATLFAYPLVFWTLRGMEVGALATAVCALVVGVFRFEEKPTLARALGCGAVGAVALLLRSDAVVPVGVVGLYGALRTRGRARATFIGAFGALVVGTVALHTLIRLGIYGDRVPNTYYLKLHGIPAFARIKRGLFVALQVLGFQFAFVAALFAVVVRRAGVGDAVRATLQPLSAGRERGPAAVVLLAAIVGAQLAYAVYVGGDAWEWMLHANRYVSAVLPLVAVLVAAAACSLASSRPSSRLASGVAPSEGDEMPLGHVRVAGALTLACAGALLLALNAYAYRFGETGVARTVVISKATVAFGMLLLMLAAVGRWAFVTEGTAWAGRLVRGRASVAVVGLGVWFAGQLHAVGGWALRNAAQFEDEARYARLGLYLRQATPADFRIAVVAAGATPYFSRRPAEDLLGKNDRVIARGPLRGVFSPGHDKWDYAYSLGERKPAYVVELADVTPEDARLVADLGFVELASGGYLHTRAADLKRVLDVPLQNDDDLNRAVAALESKDSGAPEAALALELRPGQWGPKTTATVEWAAEVGR
jgi:hypothetical protein